MFKSDRTFIANGRGNGVELFVNNYDLSTGTSLLGSSNGAGWRSLLAKDIPGFTLIEWDIAISLEDKEKWEETVHHWSEDRIQVAPYRLYPTSTGLDHPVWAHRNGTGVTEHWIETHEPECKSPAFGMIWMPMWAARNFKPPTHDPRFTDTNFSHWLRGCEVSRLESSIPVHWNVSPIHLHY